MLRLYDFGPSGNCYKIRLLLAQLGRPFERIAVDLLGGETATTRFRARNPLGQVPFIELDDGRVLTESSAILWHLAEDSRLLPRDSWARARVLQWMSFEQYRIEPNLGTARYWITMLKVGEQRRERIAEKREAGAAALAILDRHFTDARFAVDGRYTIADIALYGYTNVAGEAGLALDRYPALLAWLERVKSEPDHIPIEAPAGSAIDWPEARNP